MLDTAWKSDPTKAKSSSISSSQSHLQHIIMDKWKSARRSESVQIVGIHTNQGWNILKGSKVQTGTSTVSHDKAAIPWKNNAISFPTKISKLYKSLVLPILLYGCENWTLTADTKNRIQAFENKCYGKMLGISCRGLLKHRKLSWFDHVCHHDTLPKIIQWTDVVAEEIRINHGRITIRNGRTSRCRHCCALRTTEAE